MTLTVVLILLTVVAVVLITLRHMYMDRYMYMSPNEIQLLQINGYGHMQTVSVNLNGNPSPYQKKIIDQMWDHYQMNQGHCTALITGTDASDRMIGRFLARFLGGHGLKPILIEGFNPSKENSNVLQVLSNIHHDEMSPVIFFIDEIDVAMGKTTHEQSNLRRICEFSHSQNKATMNHFLDVLTTYRCSPS